MGFDQRIDNIIGRLEVIGPALEKYEDKVAKTAENLARMEGQIEAQGKSLSEAWKHINDLKSEHRSRLWDVLVMLGAGGISFVAGYFLK